MWYIINHTYIFPFYRDKKAGCKLMTANDSMIVAVNWISRIFVHLDNFCHSKRMTKASSLSPGYFMASDIPLDSTYKLRPWFIDIWNAKLVHKLRYLSSTFLHDNKSLQNNQPGDKLHIIEGIEDPTKFIIRTWPWKEDEEAFSLPQVLMPVFNRGINGSDKYFASKKTEIVDPIQRGRNDASANHDDRHNNEETNYGRIMESTITPESTLMNTSTKDGTQDDPLVNNLSLISNNSSK